MITETMKTVDKIVGGRLTLGRAIKAIRLSAENDKQRDFAELLNVSPSYLSDSEHDRKEVSPKKAAEMAKKLKQSEKQFIRLAIQDTLYRQGIKYDVQLSDVA